MSNNDLEKLKDAIVSGDTSNIKPQSRHEEYLLALANGETVEGSPRSRLEAYLQAFTESGIGGGSGGGGTGGGGVSSWNDLTDKPFCEEVTISDVIVDFKGVETVFDEGWYCNVAKDIPELQPLVKPNAGLKYTVEINGEIYECMCYADGSYGWIFGNTSITGRGDDTGEPFFFYFANYGTSSFATKDAGTYDVKIYSSDIYIKTLDSKYLPEGYAQINYASGTLLDSMEVSGYAELNFSLTGGKTYTVVFDGVEYQCECKMYNFDGYIVFAIGNPMYANVGNDDGTPFAIGNEQGYTYSYYWDAGDAPHTISIMGEVAEITPMSEKLIPDTIARGTDVEHSMIDNRPVLIEKADCNKIYGKDIYNPNFAYGNGRYVIAEFSNYTKSNIVYCIDDAGACVQATIPEELHLYELIYGNGVFLLAGSDEYYGSKHMNAYLYYSADGVNWNRSDVSQVKYTSGYTVTDNKLGGECDLFYKNNKLYAVRSDSIYACSDDGITFNNFTKPDFEFYRNDVAFGKGIHVSFDPTYTKRVFKYSTDGCVTWTDGITKDGSQRVCFGGDKFVAFSEFGLDAMYSYDGIEWHEASLPEEVIAKINPNWNYAVRMLEYIDGMFVAYEDVDRSLMYSLDGITWHSTYDCILSNYDFSTGRYINVVESEGKFHFLGNYALPEEDYKEVNIIYEIEIGNRYGLARKNYVDKTFATKEEVKSAAMLTSPNGTKYKLTVADDGTLSAVPVE